LKRNKRKKALCGKIKVAPRSIKKACSDQKLVRKKFRGKGEERGGERSHNLEAKKKKKARAGVQGKGKLVQEFKAREKPLPKKTKWGLKAGGQ